MSHAPNTLVVYKNRTNTVPVSLGFDVSADTITSQIRTSSGELIATWNLVFDGDGSDGEIILTLDDSITSTIAYTNGVMDFKRVVNGEPVQIFNKIEVEFEDTVTQ